jgi:DNA-binding NarL/FixJ family response regulator
MAIRFLIADDHAMVRKMLALVVQTHPGWEVCGEAENGQEAVNKAAELMPDLIIMDMAMPVLDGMRAAREILAANPLVPIVMHTLHSSPPLALEAKKAGVRSLVAKTEAGNELLSAIEAALAERSATPTTATQDRQGGVAADMSTPKQVRDTSVSSGGEGDEKPRKAD